MGVAMAKTRRYSIEVKDAKSKTVVVRAAVEWTIDEKQIAVAQIFRLPGFADSSGLKHRLSQRRAAKRNASIATKRTPKGRAGKDR
jgi:hypothetical protein